MPTSNEISPHATIISLVERQASIAGVHPVTVALANEPPKAMHQAARDAHVANRQLNSGAIEEDTTIAELTEPTFDEQQIAYAASLASEVYRQRSGPEKFLKKAGTIAGISTFVGTMAVAFGFYLADTHAEQNGAKTGTAVETTTSHTGRGVIGHEIPIPYLVGGLGATVSATLLMGRTIGQITSDIGAGPLTRRRARKEVERAQNRNADSDE